MDLKERFRKIKVRSMMEDYYHRSKLLTFLNLAYAKMLSEEGFLTQEELRKLSKAIILSSKSVTKEQAEGAWGDIYFLYEKALYEYIDEQTGNKLHLGRSRNDMYFTMYRMSLREALWKIYSDILETQEVLLAEAEKNLNTVIPYYTYGQPAQPGTWGHYLISIAQAFSNDLRRLTNAYTTINQSALGSAAGIGSAFKINKRSVSEKLGFSQTIDNSLLGNSAVDYFLEFVSDLGIINTTLSRFAADMMMYSSAECGVLDCDRSICGWSSIMPQKKNAAAVELLRSQTEHLNGYIQTCFSSASSSSFFPVHETYLYFDYFWDNVDHLSDNLSLVQLIIQYSTINKERAFDLTLKGFTSATAMAESLTLETGEPFSVTHHVVGGMIAELMDEGRLAPENMTPDLLKKHSLKILGYALEKSSEEIQELLSPLQSLIAKQTGGTPNPEDSALLLNEVIEENKKYRIWLENAMKEVERAYAELIQEPVE